MCSQLTIKTPERSHWRCSGIFIGNFDLFLHLVLVFLLLTLNLQLPTWNWCPLILKPSHYFAIHCKRIFFKWTFLDIFTWSLKKNIIQGMLFIAFRLPQRLHECFVAGIKWFKVWQGGFIKQFTLSSTDRVFRNWFEGFFEEFWLDDSFVLK